MSTPTSLALTNTLEQQHEIILSALGDQADAFQRNLIALVTTDHKLQECEPDSVFKAAMAATSMGLSLSQQLGYAYLVPYKKGGKTPRAQLQIGWRGLVQLAIRTNQYERLTAVTVYEGQLKKYNGFTGEINYVPSARTSNKIVAFLAYFRLKNGFEASLLMTKEEMDAHAKKYSQAYQYDLKDKKSSSTWSTNYAEMGQKTVLKLLLKRYGVLDDAMQQAIVLDQAAVTDNGPDYIDVDTISQDDNGNGVAIPNEDLDVCNEIADYLSILLEEGKVNEADRTICLNAIKDYQSDKQHDFTNGRTPTEWREILDKWTFKYPRKAQENLV